MGEQSIVAVGEVLWDLLPSGPRLGGAIANLAAASARLGHAAALVSCVGDDAWGRKARAALLAQSAGTALDAALLQTTTAAPTGTVGVELGPGGHPRYVFATPSAWDRIEVTPEAMTAAAAAGALCFGSLAQRDEPSRSAIRSLVLATGGLRVFDVNVRLPFCTAEVVQWSLQHADLVKISEEELARVLGMCGKARAPFSEEEPWEMQDLEDAAQAVLAFAPACHLVAVTLGPRGSLLITRDKIHRHPGFNILVEDTVGAGDAFTAGMVHAYLHGGSLKAINEVGNLCGSYVASQPGAMPVYTAALLEKVAAALG